MEQHEQISSSSSSSNCEEEMELRRGPWTVEEDFTLINYIAHNGEGRWNSLARCAGLKRTGKSCRLRWLNYLRPDVRRGNITLEEQLLILELHSRWGNRWSKIAQHLPGRTDNEIKNYWRTRVQKHAKQLKCDVNSKQFKDTMRYLWMPRLVERIQAAAAAAAAPTPTPTPAPTPSPMMMNDMDHDLSLHPLNTYTHQNNSASSDSVSDHLPDNYSPKNQHDYYYPTSNHLSYAPPTPNYNFSQAFDFLDQNNQWMDGADAVSDNFWNVDDLCMLLTPPIQHSII